MEGGKATKLALGWIRNSNGWCGRHHPKGITRLDLFIEYRLQIPVIAGFLVMRFLSGYTLVYTVF